jgi:ABC-2 type transport system permease protein
MRGLWKLTLTELKLFLREQVAAFFTLIFPLMMLFIFGSIYGNKPTPIFGGFGNVDISVPAYGAMIIATSGLISLPILLATYRELRIFARFQATPIHPISIFLAHITVLVTVNFLGLILLAAAGKLVYHLRFAGNMILVVAAYFYCSLAFLAIGFLLGSVVRSARTAQIVGMVFFFPMIFFSGATIPREFLPEAIRSVAQFLPLTHVVNLLRGLWIGAPPSSWPVNAGYLAILSALSILLAVRIFRWE